MNRKGFTLVELLGVIVIIGLIVGLSTFGIIKVYNNSKEKSLALSRNSILEAARIFASEKTNDEDRWIYKNTSGEDYTYFCMTVKELINNGILDKDKASSFAEDYVVVQKNKITFDIDDLRIVEKEDISSDAIASAACGSVPEGNLDVPSIEPISSYTDEIDASFTDSNVEGTITGKECLYNTKGSNKLFKGEVTSDNKCLFKKLKSNTEYDIKVCVTADNNYKCSSSVSYRTKDIEKPTFSISDGVTINFKDDNIKGTPSHYFKSTAISESTERVKTCTLKNNKFTCDDKETNTIKHNVWYKTDKDSISLKNFNGNTIITARTEDQSSNYNENKSNLIVHKITFNKGTADKIGGVTSNLEYSCVAENNGSCTIKSPSIEKTGYVPLGWNSSDSGTSSEWDTEAEKEISTDGIYFPIVRPIVYYVSYYNECYLNKSGTMENSTHIYDVGKVLNENQFECYANVYYEYNGATGGNSVTNIRLDSTLDGWHVNGRYIPKSQEVVNLTDNDNEIVSASAYWDNRGTRLPTPTKEGYTFDRWYRDSSFSTKAGKANAWYYPSSGETTLYAKWITNKYKVTYNYSNNGGTSSTKNTDNVTMGNNVDLTPTATKEGWTFVGWNTNKNATTGLTSLVMPANSVTLYAIFKKEAITYTAKWNNNGTTLSSTSDSTCTINEVYNNSTQATSCTVTAPTITRNGYNIIGFNNTISATASSLASGGTLTLNSSNNGKTWYAITSKNVGNLDITLGSTREEYNNTAKTPSVTIKDGTTTLTKDTDYTISYSNNTNIGTATITINGKSVYNSTTKTFYVNSTTRTFTINDTIRPNVEIKLYEGNSATGTAKLTCTSNDNESEKVCTYDGNINSSAYLQISNLTDSGSGVASKWYFNYNALNLTSTSPNVNDKFLADNNWVEYDTSTNYRAIASGGYRVLWFKFSDNASNEKTLIIKFNLVTCSASNPYGCSTKYVCGDGGTYVHEMPYANASNVAEGVTNHVFTITEKSSHTIAYIIGEVNSPSGYKMYLICNKDNHGTSTNNYQGPFAENPAGSYHTTRIAFGAGVDATYCGYIYHGCLSDSSTKVCPQSECKG